MVLQLSLGLRLKNLRLQRSLSQEQLAKEIGISRSALSMYELDQREPDLNTILLFANFFSVSTDYLLGRSEHARDYRIESNDDLRQLIRLVLQEINDDYK